MNNSRPIPTLNPAVWVIVVIVALPSVLILALKPSIDRTYYGSLAPKGIEKAWGFSAAAGDSGALVIESVAPGGAFAVAGLEAGDYPAHQWHGPWQFYFELACVHGEHGVTLDFERSSPAGARRFGVKLMPPESTGAWCLR